MFILWGGQMRKILKYPVALSPSPQEFALPRGSITRHVDYQPTQQGPEIWVEINSEEKIMDKRVFQVFGTGVDIPNGSRYIGTYQRSVHVWHLYEVF